MDSYRLRDGLSFCWIEERPVFLDTHNDRYFQLPSAMERAFVSYLKNNEHTQPGLRDLVRTNVLTDSLDDSVPLSAVSISGPSCSAVEQAAGRTRSGLKALLEVCATVYLTRRRLRQRGLRDVLAEIQEYRQRKAGPPPTVNSQISATLLDAVDEFRHARLLVPVETVCLLDSLSMVRFLAKRKLHANIVFAVCGDPFAAHCWVQAGDVALNDTVGNTAAHTPIRMI